MIAFLMFCKGEKNKEEVDDKCDIQYNDSLPLDFDNE